MSVLYYITRPMHALCHVSLMYAVLKGNVVNFIILIGRAGASPPSRTTGPRCLYIYVFMYLCIYPVRVPDTVNF